LFLLYCFYIMMKKGVLALSVIKNFQNTCMVANTFLFVCLFVCFAKCCFYIMMKKGVLSLSVIKDFQNTCMVANIFVFFCLFVFLNTAFI